MVFKKVAKNETFRHCYRPLFQQCEGVPDTNKTTCMDWPETICSTKYIPAPEGKLIIIVIRVILKKNFYTETN